MATTTTGCLNSFNSRRPPPQKSPSVPPTSTNNQLVPWNNNNNNNGNEGWWQKRCVLGVAGAAMALQMVGESGQGILLENMENVNYLKWSQERMCPQWRLNSLETTVPENLPRPSGRRRWQPAALPHTAAPQLRTTNITTPSISTPCFSL